MKPETRVTATSPHRPSLALFVKPPHSLHFSRDFLAEDRLGRRLHVLVPRSADDLVGVELDAVVQLHAVREGLLYAGAVVGLDLPVDDELRRADVDVVAAAALEVLHEHAGVHRAAVGPEAGPVQPLEQVPVEPLLDLVDVSVDGLEHLARRAPRD